MMQVGSSASFKSFTVARVTTAYRLILDLPSYSAGLRNIRVSFKRGRKTCENPDNYKKTVVFPVVRADSIPIRH